MSQNRYIWLTFYQGHEVPYKNGKREIVVVEDRELALAMTAWYEGTISEAERQALPGMVTVVARIPPDRWEAFCREHPYRIYHTLEEVQATWVELQELARSLGISTHWPEEPPPDAFQHN